MKLGKCVAIINQQRGRVFSLRKVKCITVPIWELISALRWLEIESNRKLKRNAKEDEDNCNAMTEKLISLSTIEAMPTEINCSPWLRHSDNTKVWNYLRIARHQVAIKRPLQAFDYRSSCCKFANWSRLVLSARFEQTLNIKSWVLLNPWPVT